MHSRLLKYFLAVYDCQSISAASEMLRISQPALTKSIHHLEQDLNVKLFERKPKGVVATRYATILARRAQLMDMEYRTALAEIEAAKGGTEGLIRVGAGPVWYSSILPTIIKQFIETKPGTRIKIQSGVINTLVPGLKSGKFDIICTSLDFHAEAGIVQEPIFDLSHVVIVNENHPLADLDLVQPQDMSVYPWIVLADDEVGTGRILSYFAAHEADLPKFSVETSSPTAMYEILREGDFIAQIPERMLSQAHLYGLKKIPLVGTFWDVSAGICYRQRDHRAPLLTKFIEALRTAQ